MWRYLQIIFCSLIGLWPAVVQAGSCKIKSDHILYLKGDTDEKMLDCVEKINLTGINTVLLKSRGGRVAPAIKIGELIAPLNAQMNVKDYCNSSCANYFLPLASSINVEAKAEVLLHGSIDPGLVKKSNWGGKERGWALHDQQQAYAVKHRIHRGWLLYRTQYAKKGSDQYEYIDGDFGWLDRDDPVGFIQVEPRFFESCFPEIPIVFESPTIIEQANADEKRRLKLLKKGLRPTGDWTCKGPFNPDWPIPSPDERQSKNNE